MLLGYKIKTKSDLNLLKGALKPNKTKQKPQTEESRDEIFLKLGANKKAASAEDEEDVSVDVFY
jgi:hypothetical protein